MKNALLIVNVVLIIAVATLFFLYFSNKAPKVIASVTNSESPVNPNGFKIAYFEMDSVENNSLLSKEAREAMRVKEENLNKQLQQIKDKYNKLWEESSQKLNSLSDDDKAKRKETLDILEETYKSLYQNNGAEIQSEMFKYRQRIFTEVQKFLKQYCTEKGFSYALASAGSTNDPIYYKDSMYNITSDLIKGLNEKYRSQKKN